MIFIRDFNNNLFCKNRRKLFAQIENNSIVIIFSAPNRFRNNHHEYPYRQNSNLIYLTGILEPVHSLVLIKNRFGKCSETIFVPRLDDRTIIYQGEGIRSDEIKKISGIEKVEYFDEKTFTHISDFQCIYIEKEVEIIPEAAKHIIKQHEVSDIKPIISKLRLIKEPEEIELIKNAINITGEAFHGLLEDFKKFKTEADIEAFITSQFIIKGHLPHSYLPIVANGKNAITLHYIKNNQPLQKGMLTLLDFGCELNGYASDLSRTIPNNGKFSARQLKIYNKVLDILNKVSSQMKPGTTIKELNSLTNTLMEETLVDLKLLSINDLKNKKEISPCKKYFPHGVSHFIGLDVHDSGNTETILQSGMVLSCEPGIYIPEEKIGIRLENDILVEDTPINLMQNLSISAEEIEEMSK